MLELRSTAVASLRLRRAALLLIEAEAMEMALPSCLRVQEELGGVS